MPNRCNWDFTLTKNLFATVCVLAAIYWLKFKVFGNEEDI